MMFPELNRKPSIYQVSLNDLWAFDDICYDVDSDNADEVEENILMEAITVQIDVDHPHFLIVFYVNTKTSEVNASAIHFTPANLAFIIKAAKDPFKVWEYYRSEENSVASDVPAFISEGTIKAGDNNDTIITVPFKVGLYHPEDDNEPTQEQLEIIEKVLPPLRLQRPRVRVGRFMVYCLDKKKLQELEEPAILINWWNKAIAEREKYTWMEEKLQIPWLSDKNLLKESDEDQEMADDLYKIPCILYALKDQITPEEYKELASQAFITAQGTKGTKLYKWLFDKGYKTKTYQIKDRADKFEVNCHTFPKQKGHQKQRNKIVSITQWEGHWMAHKLVKYGGKTVDFLRILEVSKRVGILRKMNAFEYGQLYDNYSVDAMLDFEPMKYVQEHETEYQFGPSEWDKAAYKDKFAIRNVYFADFESSVNEEYHRPFLLCAIGTEAQENNGKIVFAETEKYQKWGESCPQDFLDHILHKFGTSGKRGGKVAVRIYFHNLKYDFTFLMPYLRDLKEITKGGKLYSVKACYKAGGKKVYIDFWDSLPIFNSSLKNAVNLYLTKKEREDLNLRKEVMPYKFYTYKMFSEHEAGWAPYEEAKNDFKGPEEYEEFLANLKKNPEMCKENEFNYKEYAIFYCMQDVRCLAMIVNKFSNLLIGTGTEGVHGTPPFSMNLLAYRTASSIGYDYFQKTVLFKQDENGEWVPRHDWAIPKNELRALIQKTIRGGRVMCRDNQKWYYQALPGRDETLLQDYDAVSLYPSAMHQLWVTDGVPMLIKGDFTKHNFLEHFAPPEATPEEAQTFMHQDGCVHLTWLNTKRKLHFPLLCIKDPKTKLNQYRNYDNEQVDTWVNAIDLYNLIEFQDADFTWDAAVVWNGERHYEIRDSIQALFDFRLANHGRDCEHPIQNVAKLMMNSIFGKSILKVHNKEKKIVEEFRWRKDNENNWIKTDNWEEFFRANAYRIYRMGRLPGDKIEVEIYKRDTSASLNIFGSNVLAMARRIIGRVMALAEEIEAQHPEMTPGLFYTDTDSMHIRADLLELTEKEFEKRYGRPIKGKIMGTFHVDFDPIEYEAYDSEKKEMVTKKEDVKGAEESWFIMKKMYADLLVGFGKHKSTHLRMKGVPRDKIRYEDYKRIYEGQEITYNLLDGHVSFFYRGGQVGSRVTMTRTIMNNEARLERKLKRKRDDQEDTYGVFPKKSKEEDEDDKTVELPSEQDEPINEDEIIDIDF